MKPCMAVFKWWAIVEKVVLFSEVIKNSRLRVALFSELIGIEIQRVLCSEV